MNRTRLILAAVVLGALTLSPGALANTVADNVTADNPNLGPVTVGGTDTATVTVTNSGTTVQTIDAFTINGADASQFSSPGDTCTGVALDPNGVNICTITVDFNPTSAGPKNAEIDAVIDGAAAVDLSDLTGTANAAAPVISVNNVNVGNVKIGSTGSGTMTVQNTGSAALNITRISRGGDPAFALTNNLCAAPHTVPVGGSCTIGVSFSPTATTTGTVTGTVRITDNATGSPQAATLTGTALSAFVSFSPATKSFGPSQVGKAGTPFQFTLRNEDSSPLVIGAAAFAKTSGNVGAFKISADNCSGTTVAPSSSCTFSVTYTATAGGSQQVTIDVADSAPDGHQTLTLQGHGLLTAAFTNVHGTVGCTTATLQWTVPAGVAGSWIVRNADHVPVNQHDGTRVRATGHGVRLEKGLKQFHTYHYAIWAQYKYPGFNPVVYSAPKRPQSQDRPRVLAAARRPPTGTAPLVDWSPAAGVWGYGLRLFDHGHAVFSWSARTTVSSHKVPAGRPGRHGRSYQVFIFAYSNAHPRGIAIGSSSFSIK